MARGSLSVAICVDLTDFYRNICRAMLRCDLVSIRSQRRGLPLLRVTM